MPVDLSGRIALVTGGGSGIGFAFVQRLYAEGCKVLVADLALRADTAAWLASLPDGGAGAVVFQATDVSDWAQLERAFALCAERLGGVPTIVVPSAGVFEPNSLSFWQDRDAANHYKVLDINLLHPIKLTRLAVRHLVEAGIAGPHAGTVATGSPRSVAAILFVSSVAAQRASLVTPLYQASKHGINSFLRSMAPLHDLIGIKTGGVQPGTIRTPLYTDHEKALDLLDLDKDVLVAPERVADALYALLEDALREDTAAAQYASGTVLEVTYPDKTTTWRQVQLLNDPGPQGPAASASRKSEAVRGILPDILGKDVELPASFQALVKTD